MLGMAHMPCLLDGLFCVSPGDSYATHPRTLTFFIALQSGEGEVIGWVAVEATEQYMLVRTPLRNKSVVPQRLELEMTSINLFLFQLQGPSVFQTVRGNNSWDLRNCLPKRQTVLADVLSGVKGKDNTDEPSQKKKGG